MSAGTRVLAFAVTLFVAASGYAQGTAAGEEPGLKYRLLGPANGGRASREVGIHGDPLTYYLFTAAGGVWKSGNGGQTWQSVFDDQPVVLRKNYGSPVDSPLFWSI